MPDPLSHCRLAVSILLVSLLTACQPDSSMSSAGPRPAIDALDRSTAMTRKARVSEIAYDISIDLGDGSDGFSGTVIIQFDLAASSSGPQADLTVDFGGGSVDDVAMNGQPVEVAYNGFFLTFPGTALSAGSNTATVRFAHPFSKDGTGLHRFSDPVDGLTYLYSYLWPYYANRMFPLFDQPNLKARFSLAVTAPADWTITTAISTLPTPSANTIS
jgi:aminopeptidase N